MPITDKQRGTSIEEIADGLFRVSTPVPPEVIPGGLAFNQFLLVDDEPLLFHTGPRRSAAQRQRHVDRFTGLEPKLLACMDGSSFRGDGGALLRLLSQALAA